MLWLNSKEFARFIVDSFNLRIIIVEHFVTIATTAELILVTVTSSKK